MHTPSTSFRTDYESSVISLMDKRNINSETRNWSELLPVELTQRIFILCLPEIFTTVRQPNVSTAPILLCHVCGKWRRIALNTAELWAKLHTRITTFTFLRKVTGVIHDKGSYLSPKSQNFVDWWSNNVRSSPFTLSLDQPLERRGFLHSDRYEAETTIHSEAEISTTSYETFLSSPFVLSAQNLCLQSEQVLELCKIPSIEFQNLEAFSVDTVNYVDGVYFPSAPLLRRLHIRSPTALPTFPYPQLTHLCISSAAELVTLRQILIYYCPNLVFASFQLQQFRRWMLEEDASSSPIKVVARVPIPKLRQLMLSGYASANAFEFLANISFPSLTSLCLQLTRELDSQRRTDDDSFLDSLRAAPRLTDLHLTARLLCPWNEVRGFDHGSQRARGGGLAALLPHLRNTTLYVKNAVTAKNKGYFKELILSDFLRPAASSGSTTHSTTTEIVFGEPISAETQPPFGDSGFGGHQKVEEDLMAELMVHADAYNQRAPNHRLHLRRSGLSDGPCKLTSSEYFRDPSRWEETTGFHDVAHAPEW